MSTRTKMKDFRKEHHLSVEQMARKCKITPLLLRMVEHQDTTVPSIVARIQKQYGLSDLEAEELLAPNRRPHGEDYDPHRYEPLDFEYQRLPIRG